LSYHACTTFWRCDVSKATSVRRSSELAAFDSLDLVGQQVPAVPDAF
jgi:hypothetical protein